MSNTEYQKGIQEFVLSIIRSIEMVPGKRYITQKEIVEEVKKYRPELKDPQRQVKQAIYHLRQEKHYKKQRIEPVTSYTGRRLGWKVVDKDDIYKT